MPYSPMDWTSIIHRDHPDHLDLFEGIEPLTFEAFEDRYAEDLMIVWAENGYDYDQLPYGNDFAQERFSEQQYQYYLDAFTR
jgi:hypothetical protein